MVPTFAKSQSSLRMMNTSDSASALDHPLSSEKIKSENGFQEINLNTISKKSDLLSFKESFQDDDESPTEKDDLTRSLYRQILRRIDVRLLPVAVTVYFFSQLDKHNLGQAHARDFDADLHLKGNQFAGLLSIYFPCYLILHYISGIFLAQLRPRRLIPTTVLWCGVTTFCLTFCTNFTQMALGRLLLGMFEGSLSPCITILFASWYPMEKIATRLMLLHLASPISGLVGACVTAGFYQLDGMDGLQGWQWMFCVEGITTILISFPGYWLLPNLVEQDGDRFKMEKERQEQREESRVPNLVKILQNCRPSSFPVLQPFQRKKWISHLHRQSGPLRRLNDFTWYQVLRPFTELKIYLYSITAASSQVASSNIANFGPMIIKEMGYEGAKINLLSAGPLALSVFIMLICAILADRKGMRSLLLLPCLLLITIGQSLIFFDIHSKSVTYGAMYLIAGFSGPCNTLITVWCAGNIGPQYTKMATLALCLLSHTAATLISVNLFPPTDAPLFWHAHLAGMICIIIAIVSASLLTLVLWYENHKREKRFPIKSIDPSILASAMQVYPAKVREEGEREVKRHQIEPLTDDEARAFWNLEHLSNEEFARLGDRHPGIRYMI